MTLGPSFTACSLAYVVLNFAYSFGLKNVVILDALAISLGFVLRAVAGALAIGVHISSWLLVLHDPPRALSSPSPSAGTSWSRWTRLPARTAAFSPSTRPTCSTR